MIIKFDTVRILKAELMEKFNIYLHFHDACGGQYFSFDEVPSNDVLKYTENFFKNINCKIIISDNKLTFYIKEKSNA